MPVCVRGCQCVVLSVLSGLVLYGCSDGGANPKTPHAAALGDLPGVRDGPPVAHSETGLEVMVFGTSATSPRFAEVLAPYADLPLPIPRELESLWNDHGVRLISVPTDDVPAIIDALQGSGNAVGTRERQWLGQAYAWTEAVRGPAIVRPTTVALDAERIQLDSGALRLLVRGWLEPVPPSVGLPVGVVSPSGAAPGSTPQSDDPQAVLRVEFVPQHLEATARPDDRPFAAPSATKLDPLSQGLVFTRLYTKAQFSSGRALLMVAERPGLAWRELSVRAQSQEPEAAAAPRQSAESADPHWPKPNNQVRRAETATDSAWGSEGSTSREKRQPSASTAHSGKGKPPRSSPEVGQIVRGPREHPDERSAQVTESAPEDALLPGGGGVGPSAPRVPALGEAMLSTTRRVIDDRSAPVRERAVVVLIPYAPRAFRLSQ